MEGGPEASVRLLIDGLALAGILVVPERALGVVLFAHGSGSSRFSPRNRAVARGLQQAGFATLLFDLLTPLEEAADAIDGHLRFDVGLLARRLMAATIWAAANPVTRLLPLGYFGSSTGAAAALIAAARLGHAVSAVVSRGGRPDLAGEALAMVNAPTLLIVGGDDQAVLDLNRRALPRLAGERDLALVPGATHLFEEPGALEQVTRLAADWFGRHFVRNAPKGGPS